MVSILIKNIFQKEKLLKLIQSIRVQTYSDWECVLIDSYFLTSNEGKELLTIILNTDDRFLYQEIEDKNSVSESNLINNAIERCSGEYLLLLDGTKDILHSKDIFHLFFGTYRKYDSDLISGDTKLISEKNYLEIINPPERLTINFLIQSSLYPGSVFIKRNLLLKETFFKEDLKKVNEWDFFLRMKIQRDVSYEYVPIIISDHYLDNKQDLEIQNQLISKERKKVIQECLSPELIDIIISQDKYKKFYNKKLFSFYRKLRLIISKILKKRFWSEVIYNYRIITLIKFLNKKVREQLKDPLTIPIIIINYNRLKDTQKLVDFLLRRNFKNIIIVDNNSTYLPLLEYYNKLPNSVVVERMKYNEGHMVFWNDKNLYSKYSSGYYVVTDSDIIPNENLPKDFMLKMIHILNKHKNITKVGFSLNIKDIPEYYENRKKVIEWESQYWKDNIVENQYLAKIDTTFALYFPKYDYEKTGRFYSGIRMSGNYEAKHGGWYLDKNNLSEEEKYYIEMANSSTSWNS
ncbi:glycosyltransferase [Apibacter muscae]|uniref:glycosyltransferase family 2 protein n=1 Tax=Apibacter muscae TaxID=2509004 RepID=UPI0011ACF8DB|nr:glycosyltransferase [Apibacter muscae]TWP25142.1 glycosyltransferase [Apibacter muscae]